MAEHYYTGSPMSQSQQRRIDVDVRGLTFSLLTDRGVFSKGGLDEGTRRLVEQVSLNPVGHALDLGAGYGLVTAVLSTIYPEAQWTLIEINERALALAIENTSSLGNRRSAILSDGIPVHIENAYDDILLNPPIRAGKSVVYRLYADSFRALKAGGTLWVVIQKKHGAPSTAAELARLFGRVDEIYKKSGYFIFAARKC